MFGLAPEGPGLVLEPPCIAASGVGQCFVWLSRLIVRFVPSGVIPRLSTSSAETLRPPFGTFGVSHTPPCKAKPSSPPMAGTHIGRGKSDPLRVPPAVGQFSHDAGGCAFFELAFGFVHSGGGGSSDGCDVLQNKPTRTASVGNVEDVEEQTGSLAIKAGASTSNAEVLAREPRNEEIHASAPRCAIEGEQVRPDRRRIKRSRFHKADKLRGSSGFPLHVANGAVLVSKKLKCGAGSFSEHSDASADFDGMDGM